MEPARFVSCVRANEVIRQGFSSRICAPFFKKTPRCQLIPKSTSLGELFQQCPNQVDLPYPATPRISKAFHGNKTIGEILLYQDSPCHHKFFTMA
jgi:hypothetical protein